MLPFRRIIRYNIHMSPEPDFLKPPTYEVNAGAFLSELPHISDKYPELLIQGINETEFAKGANEEYLFEREKGHLNKARKIWNLSQRLDVLSAYVSFVFVYMRGDCLMASAARKEIDELALKQGSAESGSQVFDSTNLDHFLGYVFKS